MKWERTKEKERKKEKKRNVSVCCWFNSRKNEHAYRHSLTIEPQGSHLMSVLEIDIEWNESK